MARPTYPLPSVVMNSSVPYGVTCGESLLVRGLVPFIRNLPELCSFFLMRFADPVWCRCQPCYGEASEQAKGKGACGCCCRGRTAMQKTMPARQGRPLSEQIATFADCAAE